MGSENLFIILAFYFVNDTCNELWSPIWGGKQYDWERLFFKMGWVLCADFFSFLTLQSPPHYYIRFPREKTSLPVRLRDAHVWITEQRRHVLGFLQDSEPLGAVATGDWKAMRPSERKHLLRTHAPQLTFQYLMKSTKRQTRQSTSPPGHNKYFTLLKTVEY